MPLAFATRGLGADVTPERILARAQAFDVRSVLLSTPLPRAAEAHARLRAGGVAVCAVAAAQPADGAEFTQGLERGARCAAALKAGAVVVEGGGAAAHGREAAVDRLARALHAPLAQGIPLVVRNAGAADALLGFEEVEWLLSELPRLGFWFDPMRAEQRQGADAGPAVGAWLDAYDGRVGGVFVHGPGSEGSGGGHPTDDGPDWDRLAAALPWRVPWVLDLGPGLAEGDAADAVRWLRSLRP